MRNLVGAPVKVGAVTMRAATGYIYGGVVYNGVVQREIKANHWSTGRDCRHRHQTAESALGCAEGSLRADRAALALLSEAPAPGIHPNGNADIMPAAPQASEPEAQGYPPANPALAPAVYWQLALAKSIDGLVTGDPWEAAAAIKGRLDSRGVVLAVDAARRDNWLLPQDRAVKIEGVEPIRGQHDPDPLADYEVAHEWLPEAEDATRLARWWWLSFTDPNRPTGSQFLGVAVVAAGGIAEAVTAAHIRGINPGGQVMAIEIPDEHVPTDDYRNRLLTRDEAELAGDF